VKSLCYAANKLIGNFVQWFTAVKAIYSVGIACQCMPDKCGTEKHTLVSNATILPTASAVAAQLYGPLKMFADTP